MKRLFILVSLLTALTGAGPSPCYWAGAFVKCFPNSGMTLTGTGDYTLGVATTGTANISRIDIASGLGATSGRNAYITTESVETTPQRWDFGLYGDKNWTLRDQTASRSPIIVSQTTGGVSLLGTNTNDSASAGYDGEYKEAKTTSGANTGASAAYFDAQSITLTAGDWDVDGVIIISRNGATFTAVEFVCGISGTTGNSATGLVNPVTSIDDNYGAANLTFGNLTLYSPKVRVQSDGTNLYINGATISSSQVVYLKGFSSTFTGGPSQYTSFLRARRVR